MVNHIVMVTQFARIRLAHTLVSAGLVTWEMAMIAPVSIVNCNCCVKTCRHRVLTYRGITSRKKPIKSRKAAAMLLASTCTCAVCLNLCYLKMPEKLRMCRYLLTTWRPDKTPYVFFAK